MVSQLSERETRAWAEEFNQFIDALSQVITVNEKLLPRLTVVMFAKEKDFRGYLPKNLEKKHEKISGFFTRFETWGVIGMKDLSEDADTRETIYHEGVHWMLSAFSKKIPLCINEGLAEVFSSFQAVKGEAQWGQPIPSRLARLHGSGSQLISTKELLHATPDGQNYNEEDRVSVFYAKSWLLVHYMMFGKREGARSALNDFLNANSGDLSLDEAFEKGFGMKYEKMDLELGKYLRDGKYSLGMQKFDSHGKLQGAFLPASQAEVEIALAKLASAAGRQEAGLAHAEAAIRLAPGKPECWDTLAGLQSISSEEGGYEAAKKAVVLGSKDAMSYIIVTQQRTQLAAAAGDIPDNETREIADHLEKGIAVNPYYQRFYRSLARTMANLKRYTDADVQALQQGLTFFPNEPILYVGLAYIADGSGDSATAWKLLSRALANREKLDARDWGIAQDLKKRWILNDVKVRIAPMAERGKAREALEMVDSYMKDPDAGSSLREELQTLREPMALRAKYARAQEAIKGGRRDEARELLEEVAQAAKSTYQLKLDACDQIMLLDKIEANERKQKREAAEREPRAGGG
ncbi:MAG: hypothetical protein QM715_16080 [Nibricoccus sp.]